MNRRYFFRALAETRIIEKDGVKPEVASVQEGAEDLEGSALYDDETATPAIESR